MNAAAVSRTSMLGACAMALSACNLMMPSPVYTTPRQADGFRLLSVTRLELNGLKDPAGMRGAVLDGNTLPDTYSYNVVLNQYDAGGLVSYRVDEFGNASFYVLPDMYANNLGSAVADGTAGFLCLDNSGEIDRVNLGVGATEIGIPALEGNAVALLGAGVRIGGIAWSATGGGFYSLSYLNGDLAVGSHALITGAMTQVGAGPFAGGIPTIVSTFQTLVDTGSGYWGQNFIEFGKCGYSAGGAYTWFTARRVDNISGIKEERLVVLPDAGGTPITAAYLPLGTAGSRIIAYEEKRAPSHRVLVLDASLATRKVLRLVGEDWTYLGERDIMIDALPVPHALFLVMTRQRVDDESAKLYLSLYAYPVSGL